MFPHIDRSKQLSTRLDKINAENRNLQLQVNLLQPQTMANTTAPKPNQQHQQQQHRKPHPPPMVPKGYATSAASANTNGRITGSQGFTKVQKNTIKAKETPLYSPEYTRINRQVGVKTEGTIPAKTKNNEGLAIIDQNTSSQGVTFALATIFEGGTIRHETDMNSARDQGAA